MSEHFCPAILDVWNHATLARLFRCNACNREAESSEGPKATLWLDGEFPDGAQQTSVYVLDDILRYGVETPMDSETTVPDGVCEHTGSVTGAGVGTRFKMVHWPPHLIINFKRWKVIDKARQLTGKINSTVFYTTDTFNVQDGPKYRIRAIVCHAGGRDGGHNWVYVRLSDDDNAQWEELNDDKRTRREPGAVMTSEAYMLFLEKVTDGNEVGSGDSSAMKAGAAARVSIDASVQTDIDVASEAATVAKAQTATEAAKAADAASQATEAAQAELRKQLLDMAHQNKLLQRQIAELKAQAIAKARTAEAGKLAGGSATTAGDWRTAGSWRQPTATARTSNDSHSSADT